jgi:hypothetical protein
MRMLHRPLSYDMESWRRLIYPHFCATSYEKNWVDVLARLTTKKGRVVGVTARPNHVRYLA